MIVEKQRSEVSSQPPSQKRAKDFSPLQSRSREVSENYERSTFNQDEQNINQLPYTLNRIPQTAFNPMRFVFDLAFPSAFSLDCFSLLFLKP